MSVTEVVAQYAPVRRSASPSRVTKATSRTAKPAPAIKLPVSQFSSEGDEADCHSDGRTTSPELVRVRQVIAATLRVQRQPWYQPSAFVQTRAYIGTLKLSPARLYRLLHNASFENQYPAGHGYADWVASEHLITAYGYLIDGKPATVEQIRLAAYIVSRAALSLLVEVPLRNRYEMREIIETATSFPGWLPRDQRRALAKRLSHHMADALAGRRFNSRIELRQSFERAAERYPAPATHARNATGRVTRAA